MIRYMEFGDNKDILGNVFSFVDTSNNLTSDLKRNKQCIFALVRGYTNIEKYKDLIKRNNYIENNISPFLSEETDYILFHEGNITEEHQYYIQEKTTCTIKFVNIHKTYPFDAFNNDDKQVYKNEEGHLVSSLFDHKTRGSGWNTNQRAWGLNYRHMCEFHFIYILDYLKGYKYGLRIDEDCFIESKIDIFKLIQNTNLKLISGKSYLDSAGATLEMNKFCIDFMKKNNFDQIEKRWDYHVAGPYTNVFMLDIEYFSNNVNVRKFINEIKERQYIIKYRWGDLPLWGRIYKMFLELNEYDLNHSQIKYFHGSHNENVNMNFLRNNYCVILTSCVNPRSHKNAIDQKNVKDRLDCYLKSITQYLEKTTMNIILVENSGYTFEELNDYKLKYSSRFEVITYNEEILDECKYLDNYISKGESEVFSIRYAYENSKLIQLLNPTHVIKITARYFTSDIQKFIDTIKLGDYDYIKQHQSRRCEIIGCNTKFFNDIFKLRAQEPSKDQIEEYYLGLIKNYRLLNLKLFQIENTKRGGYHGTFNTL
jgi:hypothetical protein